MNRWVVSFEVYVHASLFYNKRGRSTQSEDLVLADLVNSSIQFDTESSTISK